MSRTALPIPGGPHSIMGLPPAHHLVQQHGQKPVASDGGPAAAAGPAQGSGEGHRGPVYVVRFNRVGTYCLSGGQDRTIQLWNPHRSDGAAGTGAARRIKRYDGGHGYEVLDLQATGDNNRFLSCGGDRLLFFWDVATGQVIRRLRAHDSRINCLRLAGTTNGADDDNLVFTGGWDKMVHAWDLRAPHQRTPIQTFSGFRDSVSGLSSQGPLLTAGSLDGTVATFDFRKGRLITDTVARPVTSVQLSGDGKCVLVTTLDSTLRLLDLDSGESLNEFKGHRNQQYRSDNCFSRSSGDSHVFAGSEDGRILCWDLVEAGRPVRTYEGHLRAVTCLDYHPTEAVLVSASLDGTVRCWK